MMSATLALRFTQKGAEKTTDAVTKLAQAVAQIQAAAAQPITIQLPSVGGAGRGGGGGGGGKAASPEAQAAAAEKAAARQAAAAEKVAAREAAAYEKRQVKLENFISRQRFLNAQAAANKGDYSVSGSSRIAEASAKAAAQVFTSMTAESRDAADGIKGFGVSVGGLMPGLSAMQVGVIAATGAVVGIVKASVDGAKALAGLAAEGEKLKVIGNAYEALGGSAKELKGLREMTGGVVGDTDLQKAMNLAKLFKLPAEEVPKLVKLAQGAGAALGESTAKMLSDTFTAASRGSKMIADNMGIVMGDLGKVYDDYAKKIGKTSGDQLTDQQRTAAFVSKMVAAGGRQMELATIAQGDAAALAAAQWDNLSGNLMVAVAEMFRSMGVWDMLGSAMQDFEKFAGGGIAQAGEYLGPLFQGLGDVIPPVVKAVGALVPLLAPLGQALSVVGALIEPLVPILQMTAGAVGAIATEIIDFISLAIEPLMWAASEVAGLVGDGMGGAFQRAALAMANARAGVGETTDALKANGAEAKNTADAWDKLNERLGKTVNAVKPTNESVAAFSAVMRVMHGATRASQAQLNAATVDLAKITAQFQRSGDTFEVAQRKAAKNLALIWGVPVHQLDKAADQIIKSQQGMAAETDRAMAAAAASMQKWRKSEEARDHNAAVAKLDAFNKMYFDLADRGNEYASLTSEIWRLAGDDEKKALEELDKWRAQHMDMVAAAYANDAEGYAVNASKIAQVYQTAFEAMALGDTAAEEKKKRGSGGGSKKRDEMNGLMERAAQMGMDERQLALAAADKQFEQDLKTAGKNAEGIAAAQSMYAQARVKVWMDAGRGQVEALKTGSGALRAVAAAWLEDAAAAVEMVKAAEQTLTRHRLATEEVGVGDSAEGITRRRTAREVEVQMEVEALRQEWEAKAATLQVGSDAYLTVLAEHQRKVAELTKEGDAERARADAEAATEARLAMFAGFSEAYGQVQGQLDGMLESGDSAQEAVAATLGGLLALGSEIEGTKAELTALQEKVNKGQIGETQAGVAGAGLMAAAIGRASRSIIKDKQAQAYVEALVQVGLAAASYATGDIGGGIAHTAAAASLFVAAGRGGGGGAAARALTPRRSAAGADRASQAGERQSVQQQINIYMNPLTGQAMVGAINSAGQRQAGVQLSSRVIPTGPRRPDL